ncbi:LuxR C-terminal-related transcriptional regulator, partial [Streptomyces sp. NPDC055254]
AEGDAPAGLAALRAARPDVASPSATASPTAWLVDELAAAESAVHLALGDAAEALAVLDAVASERPEHAVARARALLAAGHADRAEEALAGLPGGARAPSGGDADAALPAPVRTRACLLRAEAAASTHDTEQARRWLGEALRCARPEELRRMFVESGPWVRRMLRHDPRLARLHGRLPRGAPGQVSASPVDGPPPVMESLSRRETEVLRKAAHMLSTEEIAAELYVSANTVKTHLKSIYRKLSVTRRSEAVHRAQDLGIL